MAARDHRNPTPAIALYLFCSLVYLIVVTKLCPPGRLLSARFVVMFALAYRLTAFSMASEFTDDLYRYRWEGRLQLAGGNPYQERPGDPVGSTCKTKRFLSWTEKT